MRPVPEGQKPRTWSFSMLPKPSDLDVQRGSGKRQTQIKMHVFAPRSHRRFLCILEAPTGTINKEPVTSSSLDSFIFIEGRNVSWVSAISPPRASVRLLWNSRGGSLWFPLFLWFWEPTLSIKLFRDILNIA